MSTIHVSAPGRICLFGDHQDQFGLPVIAAAISLRTGVHATVRQDRMFSVYLPDIGERCEIDPCSDPKLTFRPYCVQAGIHALRRLGVTWSQGWDVVLHGSIPDNAGMAGSAAMAVMWHRFLLKVGENVPPYDELQLAMWAHEAEFPEVRGTSGTAGSLCAVLGGLLWIDAALPFQAVPMNAFFIEGLVVGCSPHQAVPLETLARNYSDASQGIQRLKERFSSFDLATTPIADVDHRVGALPPEYGRRLRAILVTRNITQEAREAILRPDQVKLGHLLTLQHVQLRDGLDLSTRKIERMIDASMRAGALGAKVNGSGGCCMVAYAPGKEAEVADAITREGGTAFPVGIDSGVRVGPW